jgi:hypothetical protein
VDLVVLPERAHADHARASLERLALRRERRAHAPFDR